MMPVIEVIQPRAPGSVEIASQEHRVVTKRMREINVVPAKRGSVLAASAWSLIGYGGSQTLRLLNNMVLSYLLVPEAFGTMAIVNLVIVGLGMFSEVGSGPCIIQHTSGDQPAFLNTAWVIGVCRGFVIAVAACILANPIATFYEQPDLSGLLFLASTTAIIDGFCSPTIFLLQRHLNLKQLASLDLRSQLVGSVVMCSAAWCSPTAWSLVFGFIATSLTRTLLSFRLVPEHVHRLRGDRMHANELLRFGKWIFISTVIAFGAMQVDRLMMAKMFDLSVLGIYGFALAIATMPRMLIEKLCMSILYPILARSARQSIESLSDELIRARGAILAVGAAMILSVFLWAPFFFDRFYHSDYQIAGNWCRWLCASVWVSMLSLTISRALIALGDTRALALFNAIKLSTTILASLVGKHYFGLPGFIAGLTVGVLLGHLAITASLLKHRLVVARQDVLLSVAIVVVAAIQLWIESTGHWDQLESELFALLPTILSWVWALAYVNAYRQHDNRSSADSPPEPILDA